MAVEKTFKSKQTVCYWVRKIEASHKLAQTVGKCEFRKSKEGVYLCSTTADCALWNNYKKKLFKEENSQNLD